MQMKCLVVDDEPLARQLLKKYIDQTSFLQLAGEASDASQALDFLSDNAVDLLFLDIQMPDLSGMDFARALTAPPKIIFTTAFEQYALDGYKLNALDYLLKPFDYQEFLTAAHKAQHLYNLENNAISEQKDKQGYLMIKADYKLLQIAFKDILFIEGVKDYVKIHLSEDAKSLMSLLSMKTLEEKLPANFMRVHRSYIVNLDQIKVIERSQIVFGNTRITVSDKYREAFGEFISRRFLE